MGKDLKDILLKDISARLPYGTMTYLQNSIDAFDSELCTLVLEHVINDEYVVKPYLFPMSSMTEEQCYEFYCRFVENEIDYNDFKEYYFDNGLWHKVLTSIDDCSRVIDWFNKNHFDYRNLIDKKLAIDCTNLNIY